MSGYRSYYDYRKSYEPRNASSTTTTSSNSTKSTSKTTTSKPEEEKSSISRYTTSYKRFPTPSTVVNPAAEPTSSENKICKEMRAKYGPDGYRPKTDPPITYNNKKFDSTPRYSNLGSQSASTPRSRGTSPLTVTKTENLYSNYTPYKYSSHSSSLSSSKDPLGSTPSSRRSSREDLSRISMSSLKPAVSTRYRTTSTSSTRSSREDLSRIGATTSIPTSVVRRDSLKSSVSSSVPTTSLSRRNSRDELNKISTVPLRYTTGSSVNRYGSSYSSKTDSSRLYSSSRRTSPVPTSLTSNYSSSTHSSRPASQDLTLLVQKIVNATSEASNRDDASSVASTVESTNNDNISNDTKVIDEVITVTVMTRGTSPSLPTSTSSTAYTRTKRSDIARQIQRDIIRPKIRPQMCDKEVQSDRTDDTARYSRFASSTTRLTTPSSWNPFLDLKYSTPSSTYSKYSRSSSGGASTKDSTSSSKSSSVNANVVDNETKLQLKKEKSDSSIKSSKSTKSTSSSIPTKNQTNERASPTKLPPTIPKTSSTSTSSQHSFDLVNKDFRKSVLNMNQFSKQKSRSRSSSDSENTTTSSPKNKDIKTSASSKGIPVANKIKSPSRSRSASTDDSSSASSVIKTEPSKGDLKSCSEHIDENSITEETSSKSESRTSQGISELTVDEPPKYRIRPVDSGEKPWWYNTQEDDQQTEVEDIKDKSKSKSKSKTKSDNVSTKKGKLNHIRPIESGELAWWLQKNSSESAKSDHTKSSKSKLKSTESFGKDEVDKSDYKKSSESQTVYKSFSGSNKENIGENQRKFAPIRMIESGERAWWLKSDSENEAKKSNSSDVSKNKLSKSSSKNAQRSESSTDWWAVLNSASSGKNNQKSCQSSDNEDNSSDELENYVISSQGQVKIVEPPLGDRLSPDGIETTGEDEMYTRARRIKSNAQFISKHTNIDDLLNTEIPRKNYRYDRLDSVNSNSSTGSKLDDSALQLYKDGDYGAYLDLEASISEQQEEFDGFQDNRKNSIILRTQLSVRVHSIIEKLLNSESRELRRALFSLKQIFQEDKDLVHEFVQNDGLSCLIKVGTEVDQNYQNYILRALGQLMLYVDGMNGVIEHNLTVQWLYSLIASKFRLVVKTALKLLLVFVEYVETNCILLIKAVEAVDNANGTSTWSILMRLLKDYDSADTELLIYAMTLINKCLNGIPDQDTYYDQVDSLEEQGIENVINRYMTRQGTDLDLLRQFQIYEAVLEHEDGDQKTTQLDEAIRKTLRNRKSVPLQTCERRKSRRHSTGTSSTPSLIKTTNNYNNYINKNIPTSNNLVIGNTYQEQQQQHSDGEDESSSSQSSQGRGEPFNGKYNDNKDTIQAGVTPALRRRRERAERQRSFIREQETAGLYAFRDENKNTVDLQRNNSNSSVKLISSRGNTLTPQLSGEKHENDQENLSPDQTNGTNGILKKPWAFSMMYSKSHDEQNGTVNDSENNNQYLQINKENSVKDITQKLSSQNILHSPSPISDETRANRIGDMSGLIFKAKEGLAKSKSKIDVLRSPTSETQPKFTVPEVKKTESELHWEELARTIDRPLNLCDLDFTDLGSSDELDVLAPSSVTTGGPPPPPPPAGNVPPTCPSGPPSCPPVFQPPSFRTGFSRNNDSSLNKNSSSTLSKKNKKTVKLFWKEVREDPITLVRLQNIGTGGMIWDELKPVQIDTQKLEHLFESRAKDSLTKKQQELNKNKEIIVLDHKRSNAINIGMTKLPPPRTIKTAILKMDATIMNREGIEKLLTMLPTEEERTRIQDAQATNPDLPLGSAEQFLLTLASISELPARLKLWAFKLDFECSEREIAEPLMDLKQGIELLKSNKTFRAILSTLLSIGIFLNGSDVKGFQIDYLAKVPEVKDTVHKHSLLHHLCHMVMEKFPDSTDLYSEIGAITRVSKVDFDELRHNIQRLETDCKASWDHLKLIAKHDGTTMKVKMSDFLADCAERIILLNIVHRRVLNRYCKFLLWIGVPLNQVADTKPNEFCRIVSEFALEYRTTRERVLQQLEKKANHRERNKTRGKMITEVGKFSSKEERADAELRHVLGTSDISDIEGGGTLPWRRRREQPGRMSAKIALNGAGDLTDADDEILESLVKTATKAPTTRTVPRERKRTRNVDRKSMRRTLKNGLSEEDKKHLAAFIKGY